MRVGKEERRFKRQRASFTAGLVLIGALVVILQARWVAENKALFRGNIEVTPAGEDTEWVRCSTCRGKGRVTWQGAEDRPVLCPICFGVRGRSVVIEDELEGLCSPCQGMGRILNYSILSGRPCRLCDTRGVMRIPPGFLVCPECNGQMESVARDGSGVTACWLCEAEGLILGQLPGFEPNLPPSPSENPRQTR